MKLNFEYAAENLLNWIVHDFVNIMMIASVLFHSKDSQLNLVNIK